MIQPASPTPDGGLSGPVHYLSAPDEPPSARSLPSANAGSDIPRSLAKPFSGGGGEP